MSKTYETDLMFDKLNEYGKKREPIFFAVDFEMKRWIFEDKNFSERLDGKIK